MTENTPEREKTPHILFVGKTAIDFVPMGTKLHGFFSGNAAHAAMAANYGSPQDHPERGYKPVRISAVTTLGTAANDDIHKALRNMFANAGIEIFSHEDAQVFKHVYLPGAGSLREEVISRRIDPPNFAFEPLNIPGVKDLSPDVVVIGGTLATDPRTSRNMLEFGRHFRAKGSLIMADLWRAPEDTSTIGNIISIAHVVKMNRSLLLSTWGDKEDPENDIKAVKKILKLGKRVAVITGDERVEAITYWQKYQVARIPESGKRKIERGWEFVDETFLIDRPKHCISIRRNCAQPSGIFRHSVNADEMLTGALARAFAENNVTPQNLRSGLMLPDKIPDHDNKAANPKLHNSGFVSAITGRAVEIQARAIKAMDRHPKDRDRIVEVESLRKMFRLINGKHLTS